jgi:hypothetical protein
LAVVNKNNKTTTTTTTTTVIHFKPPPLSCLTSSLKLGRDYKYGQEIVKSLEAREHPDFDQLRPVAKTSQLVHADAKAADQVMLDEENRKNWKNHAKRVNAYVENKPRVYGFIWSQCTDMLQQRIEGSKIFLKMTFKMIM